MIKLRYRVLALDFCLCIHRISYNETFDHVANANNTIKLDK